MHLLPNKGSYNLGRIIVNQPEAFSLTLNAAILTGAHYMLIFNPRFIAGELFIKSGRSNQQRYKPPNAFTGKYCASSKGNSPEVLGFY